MKIYIMCDVSRISGLLGGGNGLPPWYWFPELEKDDLRVKMAREINKAARAALQAGATEILAHEACPVDMVSLNEEVKLIRGGRRLYLDKSFAGIAFIGQGLAKSVKSSNGIENNIRKIEFNGKEVDEMTICALYAFAQGVPTLCASGENDCFKNLKRFIPDLIVHQNSEQAMINGMKKIGGKERGAFSTGRVGPRSELGKQPCLPSHWHGPTEQNGGTSCPALPTMKSLRQKIDVTFHFGSETLATMHTRLSNVIKTGKRTTVAHAKNINEAFDAYCSSGLVASVDWLSNANVHKSCRK